MSDPIDIKALDEYLKGSSDISQRYRELGREDVPPELDRRVLEAARAAVADDGAKRSRSWLRWSAPVALAASVVLVVTVVIESGVQKDATIATQAPAAERKSDAAEAIGGLTPDELKLYEESAPLAQKAPPPAPTQFVPEEPAAMASRESYAITPAPASAPASPPPSLAKAESQRAANVARQDVGAEEVQVDAKARDESRSVMPVTAAAPVDDSDERHIAAEQPMPTLPPSIATVSARKEVDRSEAAADADKPSELSEVVVTGNRSRRATGRTAGPRNTVSSSAAGAALSDEAEHADPEKWLEEIRELRRAAKAEAADREWQRFQETFPDFRVAADDIARKKP